MLRVTARTRAVKCTTMRIRFHGAALEVTASCRHREPALVDCGLVQGGSEALKKHRFSDDFDCALDFMLLTHANIDHSRLIPHLAHKGFRGCGGNSSWYGAPSSCGVASVWRPECEW